MIKPPVNGCECGGRGYDVFDVNREPGAEIERNDSCSCLAIRIGRSSGVRGEPSDDDAASVFVSDLERGDVHARRCALQLLGLPEDLPSDLGDIIGDARVLLREAAGDARLDVRGALAILNRLASCDVQLEDEDDYE